MQVAADAAASGGQYIYHPGGPNDNGAAYYEFTIPIVPWTFTRYNMWAKVWAPDSSSDSVYYSIDGGAPVVWYIGATAGWTWVRAPDEIELAQGVGHTLRFTVRENNLRIDVVNFTDRHWTSPPPW